MRNAGDRVSGGSSGRRQRGALPQAPPRPGGNGGASLFTPAYRVSHAAGTQESTQDRYGAGQGRPGPGYSWAETGQAGYSPGGDDALPDAAWADDDPPARRYPWSEDETGGEELWSASGLPGYPSPQPKASSAVRGFPPKPDESLPVYPPGPFAAWNRSAAEIGAGHSPGSGTARRDDPSGQLAAASITPVEFDTDYSLPAIKDPEPAAGQARPEIAGHGSSPRPGRVRQHAEADHAARRSRQGRAGTHAKHQSVRLAIGVAALIVVTVALMLVVTSLGSGNNKARPQAATTRPTASPSPTAPAGPWKYIGSRGTDPTPLTLAELYPAGFTSSGVFYRRSVQAKGTSCRAALIGASLQAAVRRAGCTQVLRASYIAHAAKVMGTIGVFNLKSAASANTAALAAGHSEFVAQLPAKAGPSHRLGQGTGVEEAFVKGHYLVLAWAEFTGLSTPKTSAQRQELEDFMKTLTRQTVNVSLSDRMVTGKPAPSGG